MSYLSNIIYKLTKQLLPSGRAFRMFENSIFEKFQSATSISEETLINDVKSIFDSTFPDNVNFDSDDATRWERALGLIINTDADIEDRKKAITRKLNHPGTIKARCNYRYIEKALRDAGFLVRVFENRFDLGNGKFETKTVGQVALNDITNLAQHGGGQHGALQHGQQRVYKIANSIEPNIDLDFNVGDYLGHTFFICGEILGTNAVVPLEREREFRKLVLTLKPVQTVAYAFIDVVEPTIEYILEEEDGEILDELGSPLIEEII